MTSLSVFVYTKNTDLHVLSAKHAIIHSLGVTSLEFLKRYTFWKLTFDQPNEEEAKKAIEKMMASSFYLLNPNKQAYLWSLNSQYFHVMVKRASGHANTLCTLFQKRGYRSLIQIETATVWEIGFSGTQEELCEKVLASTSSSKGLLLNPLFETYSFF